ncbi:MAG: RadC family protein [Clostridia bacterium]|nr:RadC family protein [Clostridia bacterium]
MENKQTNIHKNHRQRLKNKVRNNGLESLAYHEVLEFLLTYTIPRKDTNPIGHNLLKNFGAFCDVIDADYYDLLKVEGIGPETALFLNSLSSVMDIYNKSKQERISYVLKSPGACVKYFRSFYSIKNNENMILVGLSANKRIIKVCKYEGHNDVSVNFNLKQVINQIRVENVNSVVLFHTHPNGKAEPSIEDIDATQTLINMCLSNGIDFDDHIILNETDYYSFSHEGLINKMKSKFASLFGNINMFFSQKPTDEEDK